MSRESEPIIMQELSNTEITLFLREREREREREGEREQGRQMIERETEI